MVLASNGLFVKTQRLCGEGAVKFVIETLTDFKVLVDFLQGAIVFYLFQGQDAFSQASVVYPTFFLKAKMCFFKA